MKGTGLWILLGMLAGVITSPPSIGAGVIALPATRPMAQVSLQVNLPDLTAEAQLRAVDGSQVGCVSSGEAAMLAPGQYRVCGLTLTTPSGGKPAWLSACLVGSAKPLELKAGANTVTLGAPFRVDFVGARYGQQLDLVASITGAAGESYLPIIREDRGDLFGLFIRCGAKERLLAKLGFG